MKKIKLEIGQTWISEIHPHQSFIIYGGTYDSFVVSDLELYDIPFEELPQIELTTTD